MKNVLILIMLMYILIATKKSCDKLNQINETSESKIIKRPRLQ